MSVGRRHLILMKCQFLNFFSIAVMSCTILRSDSLLNELISVTIMESATKNSSFTQLNNIRLTVCNCNRPYFTVHLKKMSIQPSMEVDSIQPYADFYYTILAVTFFLFLDKSSQREGLMDHLSKPSVMILGTHPVSLYWFIRVGTSLKTILF